MHGKCHLALALTLLGLARERPALAEHGVTLAEAIALAVRRNPALAAAHAQVNEAAAGMVAARGLDDVVIEANATWRDTRLDAVASVPGQQRAFDVVLGSMSLIRPLASGGRLAVQAQSGYGRSRSEADAPGTGLRRWVSTGTTPALQLALEQPLLRGFGVAVARADRRRARIQHDGAAAGREALMASLLRDVIGGYWELVYAADELVIRRASAAAAREQLHRVQATIAVGKLPPSATAEIEVAMALRDDAALATEQAVTERSLALGLSCGMPAAERLVAIEPLPELDPVSATPAEQLLGTARARNAQLRAASQRRRAAAVDVEVAENALLPQLDVSLAGGRLGATSDPAVADRLSPGFAGYTLLAGLAFALPIERHGARGAWAAAGERLRKARFDEQVVAARVEAEVLGVIARRETALRRARLLGPSARAAELDLEAEKARFDVGRASNFDVLRRQDQLASVQLLLLRARVDQLAASAELDALTGEILERIGVTRAGER